MGGCARLEIGVHRGSPAKLAAKVVSSGRWRGMHGTTMGKRAAIEEVDSVEEWRWHGGDGVGTTCALWREEPGGDAGYCLGGGGQGGGVQPTMMKRRGGSCHGGACRRTKRDASASEMSIEEGDPAKREVVWWWLSCWRGLG